MNDLVIGLVAQNLFDLTCMQSLDLIQLLRAVVDQAAGKLPPLDIETAHAFADSERAVDFFQA